jgi:hypothetical protein
MLVLNNRNNTEIKFTGTCTEIIDIDSVKEHPYNAAWRSDSEKTVEEEKSILRESIIAQGLREAVTMYENSDYVISGHTRLEELRKLGCTEFPVLRLPRTEGLIEEFGEESEIDPLHQDVLREHAISNTRVNPTVYGRYLYSRSLMSASVESFDVSLPATKQVSIIKKREICKQAGIGESTFNLIENLRFGYTKAYKGESYFVEPRLDLYDDLGNPDKDYTVRHVNKMQWNDYRESNFTEWFSQQDFMDDMLEELNFNQVVFAVKDNLSRIEALAADAAYPTTNWFNEADDNYISATIHHMICSFTCVEINKIFEELGFEARAEQAGNQGHYDILIKDRDDNDINSLEVKTTFGKTNWSSGSNKKGYGLLFAYTKERDRFFAASTYVSDSDWSGGGGIGGFELSAKTLHNKDDVKYYIGDIERDNDIYRIQKYRL